MKQILTYLQFQTHLILSSSLKHYLENLIFDSPTADLQSMIETEGQLLEGTATRLAVNLEQGVVTTGNKNEEEEETTEDLTRTNRH